MALLTWIDMSKNSRYTKTHCCIDKNVVSGRTLVFDNILTAEKKASEINSYYYEVYAYNDRGRLVTNGEYAVPK